VDESIVHYEVSMVNGGEKVDSVKITILDENDHAVAESEGAKGDVTIQNPKLWQPLDAYLYNMKVELLNDNECVDVYTERFGIRSVEVKDGQ
ncbi:beta-glucuronidase, partial [Staphylococcus capitis]